MISEAVPPERFPLAVTMVQQGRWTEFFGVEEKLFPLRVIEGLTEEEKQKVPLMFLFHGRDDSAVPVEGTEKFVAKVREVIGDEIVSLYTGPEEHRFDGEVGLEEGWMKEGLERIMGVWLGQ